MTAMQDMEERIAYLERMVDDLSETVARQDTEITRLTRRLDLLIEREAAREAEAGGTVSLGDQKPPHW